MSSITPEIIEPEKRKPGNPNWEKGKSANPGGRPKDHALFREAARVVSWEALDTIVEILRETEDDKLKLRAAEVLIERGWGKVSPAELEINEDTGAEFIVSVTPTKPKSAEIELDS